MRPENQGFSQQSKPHERCSGINIQSCLSMEALLKEYGPKIVYIKGMTNMVKDAISHLYYNPMINPHDDCHHISEGSGSEESYIIWKTFSKQ